MNRSTFTVPAAALGGLLALAACDRVLVPAAPQPAQLAIALSPSAYEGLPRGSRAAFDQADSARVVLLDAATFGGTNPFVGGAARMADTVFAFGTADTVRLTLELPDSALVDTADLVLGVMLKFQGEPIFVFLDSLRVAPNETTFAPVPVLFPVPGMLTLSADRDSLEHEADSTLVRAIGLFATGDTIPPNQFFPDLTTPDTAVIRVLDLGDSARVRPVRPGTGRVVGRAQTVSGVLADTVQIVVRPPPPPADTASFAQLAVGGSYACGLDGAGQVFCWGANAYGNFGDGTTTGSTLARPAAGGMAFLQMAAGADHACGIAADGTAHCWGRNDRGQLGLGTTAGGRELVPMAVAGGPWQSIAAGESHTCAIAADGTLHCWGSNHRGQLGIGGLAADNGVPTQVGGEHWSEISLGLDRTCGVTTSGVARCWGAGSDGALGNGTVSDAFTPVAVSGGPWAKIRVGRAHTCGVDTGGIIHCWGRNTFNQLGLPGGRDNAVHPSPTVTLRQAALLSLDAGSFHTCIVRQSDTVFECWGDDSEGQLGSGTAPEAGWHLVDASGRLNFTCALRTDSNAFCWGDGSQGTLGNGATADSRVPVPLPAPAAAAFVPPRAAPTRRPNRSQGGSR